MKAISLTQPWASLMAIGAKHYETRSWGTRYRGPIVIAAAKSFPQECKDICVRKPFSTALADAGFGTVRQLIDVCGHLLCVVDLIDCIRVDGDLPRTLTALPPPGEHELSFGDYTAGRFAWATSNLRRLSTPIPAKGALGLWGLFPADADEVMRQIARAA